MAGMQVPTFTDAMSQVKPDGGSSSERFNPNADPEAFGNGQSTQRLQSATMGALSSVADYQKEQKERADQVAHIAADTKASETQTTITTAIQKMKGQDALGAQDYAQARWDTDMAKIQDGLVGQNQKLAFARTAAQRWQELNKSVQTHTSNEMENFGDQTFQGAMNQSRNATVVNAGDDEIIGQELEHQKALMDGWAKRKGIPQDSDIYKNKLTAETSATHLGVVNARIEAGLDDGAQKYYDTHKSEMSAEDILHAESRLDASKVVGESSEIFDKIVSKGSGFKFSDGSINGEKVRQAVMQETKEAGMSDQRSLKVLGQVKAQVAEYNRDRFHQVAANERSFANEVIANRKNGMTLQDAMKSATKWGTDAYDIAQKAQFVEKTYSPPVEDQAVAHEQLREGIQNGVTELADIDRAHEKGQISVSSWSDLRQQKLKTAADGTDPMMKQTDNLIKVMAQKQIGSDKEDLANFQYALNQKAAGKTPDEKLAIAKQELEKVPDPDSWFWSKLGLGKTSRYKVDAAGGEAREVAQGAMYQDVGYKQVQAISSGMTGAEFTRDSNPEEHLQAFANDLGLKSIDEMKIGTPYNNAIQSLQRNGKQVTPNAVRTVLKRYPDGNWSKGR